jgi:hypothetical protein
MVAPAKEGEESKVLRIEQKGGGVAWTNGRSKRWLEVHEKKETFGISQRKVWKATQ